MTTLTEKMTALEGQLADQNAVIAGYIDTVEDKLQLLADNLDTIIVNNAANTRYLLAAIGQNSPCAPCPTPSITVPPTDATGRPVNEDRCKRVQALLHTIQTVLASFDDLMALNVTGAWTLISDVYGQTFATLGSSDTIPLPSFPEAVNIAGNYFSFAAGHLFSGETASGDFAPLLLELRDGLFLTSSADAAQAQYAAIIGAGDFSNEGKLLLTSAGYNELFSYFLDPSTEPDLSGYDGTVCEGSIVDITECTDFVSFLITTGGHDFDLVQTAPVYSGYEFGTAGDFFGFTFQVMANGDPTNGVNLYYWDTSDGQHLWHQLTAVSDIFEMTEHTNAMMWVSSADDGHTDEFTIRICPPS